MSLVNSFVVAGPKQ